MTKYMRLSDFCKEVGLPEVYYKRHKVEGAMFKMNPALRNSPYMVDTEKMLKHLEKLGRYK